MEIQHSNHQSMDNDEWHRAIVTSTAGTSHMNMTHYHNNKDIFTKIGHIANIHPTKHYRNICQKQLNEVLDIMTNEVAEEDKPYFANYGATIKPATFDVKIKPSKPSI
eukprot:5984758-Ditylum_brightwellii.AAC.1